MCSVPVLSPSCCSSQREGTGPRSCGNSAQWGQWVCPRQKTPGEHVGLVGEARGPLVQSWGEADVESEVKGGVGVPALGIAGEQGQEQDVEAASVMVRCGGVGWPRGETWILTGIGGGTWGPVLLGCLQHCLTSRALFP